VEGVRELKAIAILVGALLLGVSPVGSAIAQQPVAIAEEQLPLLDSPDPQLAYNKRLAFDFWRLVLEAGRIDLIDRFVTADFIQHNPNMRSGRDYFAKLIKTERPVPLEPKRVLSSPLISIIAERDMVVMLFRVTGPDPDDPIRQYSTTRHDTYRIEDGKLAEHWDIEVKGVSHHSAALSGEL